MRAPSPRSRCVVDAESVTHVLRWWPGAAGGLRALAAAVPAGVCTMLIPLLLERVYAALASRDRYALLVAGVLLMTVATGDVWLEHLRFRRSFRAAHRRLAALRAALAARALQASPPSAPALRAALEGLARCEQLHCERVTRLPALAVGLLFVLVAAVLLDPRLALISTGTAALVVLGQHKLARTGAAHVADRDTTLAEESTLHSQWIEPGAALVARGGGATPEVTRRFCRVAHRRADREADVRRVADAELAATNLALQGAAIVAALAGGLIVASDAAVPTLAAMVSIQWRLSYPVAEALAFGAEVRERRADKAHVASVMARSTLDGATRPPPSDRGPALEGRAVALHLDGRRVLAPLTLRVSSGERVALVGPSGVGKTTLLRLAAALQAGYAGSLTIDGIELRNVDEHWMRETVQYVQPTLVRGTLHENLTLGSEVAGSLSDTLRVTGFDRVLARLPAGLASQVDHGTLSAGEVQRLALARALLRAPRLLLLDEITSALDPASSRALLAALGEHLEREGTTVVLVTHGAVPSWIDRVVTLGDERQPT